MAAIKKQLTGSTLVEVMVAMIIMMVCIGIALTIFTNISRDVNDEIRILAEMRMNAIAAETKVRKDFTNTTAEFGNMRVERNILPYPASPKVKVLMLETVDLQGKIIAEYKELIIVEKSVQP